MRLLLVLLAVFLVTGMEAPPRALAHPVLIISIDGLRPGDVIEARARGLNLPTLGRLLAEGAFASDVVNVIPTVTYPNHTTLITGVRPATHGIANNAEFDPLRRNQEGWYWYASDIKAPTLWDAVHASGGVVASIGWPVSVGARSIDDNIPEYWRARNSGDIKLLRALSTEGLPEALEKISGTSLAAVGGGTEPENDEAKAKFAAALYTLKRPAFFTLHLSSLDHLQHIYGPGTPEAHRALERIDADISSLLAAARAAEPDLVVAVVSDHGFAGVEHDVNLVRPFVEAGLITLGPASHKPTGREAMPWGGASVAVVLARPDDPALQARVRALLARLAADPSLGINKVIEKDEIKARGIGREASFYIDFKLGYEMGENDDAPPVSASLSKGMHGWFSDHPEMHSTFIIEGPGIHRDHPLGQIDMRDIAPTLAKVLGVPLPSADGKPLF